MVSSLSERFRRAVVSDDLASAKLIAERAFAETCNDAHPFDIRNQTVLRAPPHLASSSAANGGAGSIGRSVTNCKSDLLPALSAAQHHFVRQSRGRERNREAGRCKSSLAIAIEHGASIELIQWLLEMGHERGIISHDVRNCTPVSIAAQHNRIDAIEACCIDCVVHAATRHHQRSTTFDTQHRGHDEEEEEEEEEERRGEDSGIRLISMDESIVGDDEGRLSVPTVVNSEGQQAAPLHSTTGSDQIKKKRRTSTDKKLHRLPLHSSAPEDHNGHSEASTPRTDGDDDGDDDDGVETDEELMEKELQQLLDSPDELGRTALSLASMQGFQDVVKHLLDRGASINLADYEGNTPLHYAASYNHILIVQLLIERGCAFASKNSLGFTAADYAYTSSLKGALEAFARAKYERDRKGVYDSSSDERVPLQKFKHTLFSPAKALQATPQFRLATQLRDLHL